jgi:indole-3-glycerol phosphate synthase
VTTTATAPDLLSAIVAATRTAVAYRAGQRPMARFEQQKRTPDGEAFAAALARSPAPRIIAECKRRSPSRGILREHYEPAGHAAAYAAAGAAAISVLTEPTFFDGAAEHLEAVRQAVSIPVLRKDFIVTDYQIHEAAALGADAVLLIVAALSDRELRQLQALAQSIGLAALLEVHDGGELKRAIDAGAHIIGVNSRNLRTLQVDASVPERLAEQLPREAIAVAESGIRSRADIDRLSALRYDAFLVGERLITRADPAAALRSLRSA